MFGAGVVAQHVWDTLRTRQPIRDALGSRPRIHNLMLAPQGSTYPLALHYAENGAYTGPVQSGIRPTEETVQYVLRLICQGESDAPIRAAAEDAMDALTLEFSEATVTHNGADYSLSILPTNEWPITTVAEGGVLYRQLGFYLSVQIFRL